MEAGGYLLGSRHSTGNGSASHFLSVAKPVVTHGLHAAQEAIRQLVESGVDVNEVEAAGNTPLHNAAYEGWFEGVQLLLQLSGKVNASNNAGDRPWHWAKNMGHTAVMQLLEAHGATTEHGQVLVQEHVPKVTDFYSKDCWSHHPKPYADFVSFKSKEYAKMEDNKNKAIHV